MLTTRIRLYRHALAVMIVLCAATASADETAESIPSIQQSNAIPMSGGQGNFSPAAERPRESPACDHWSSSIDQQVVMVNTTTGWFHPFFSIATVQDVTRCVATGADPNSRIAGGWTPLHFAAALNDSAALIVALLDAGADIHFKNESGETPLHMAGLNPATEVTITLIEAGCDPNTKAASGATPLHYAASDPRMGDERTGVVIALLHGGADPNSVTNIGLTPLHFAAERLRLGRWGSAASEEAEILKVLVDAGAKIEARDNQFGTPLHVAAEADNLSGVNALLNAGADPNSLGFLNVTPLHSAMYAENVAIAVALLQAGAETVETDVMGNTALHYASKENRGVEFFHALLAHGADPNARNEWGESLLHHAAKFNRNASVVSALIASGADPDARDMSGHTPLHHGAEFNSRVEVIFALIAGGADPNAEAKGGERPIHSAALRNPDPEIVSTLLDAGSDPNAQVTRMTRFGDAEDAKAWGFEGKLDPEGSYAILLEGSTPLHIAVRHNPNHQVITILLEGGGDPSIEDNSGQTPWDYATEREYLKDTEGYWRLNDARWQ